VTPEPKPVKPAAEVEVTEAIARGLIESQFPDLRGASIAAFGDGWDNTAFLVDGRLVFRFPRRALAAGLVATEAAVLPRLAEWRLPLATPHPDYVGAPAGGYPWMFTGYPMLAGRTACSARLDHAARRRAAPVLAGFLRALHGVMAEEARAWGAPEDTLGRLDFAVRRVRAVQRLEQVDALGLVPGVLGLAPEFDDPPPAPAAAALVHGDLYARHVLVGVDGLPCGIIDWGDVHMGHPAVDLALVFLFLPPDAQAAFWTEYGTADAGVRRRARLRAVHHAAATLLAAHETGDADLLEESRGSLARLAAG